MESSNTSPEQRIKRKPTGAIIGIDPGNKGGIACLHGSKIVLLERPLLEKTRKKIGRPVSNFTMDVKAMVAFVKQVLHLNPVVYIEKVHSMPGQGVASMFTFGKGYGMWVGICIALGLEVVEVNPRVWKDKVLARTDKSKKASIQRCKELFPDIDLKPGRSVKDHDGLAEAILIAVYGGLERWRSRETLVKTIDKKKLKDLGYA